LKFQAVCHQVHQGVGVVGILVEGGHVAVEVLDQAAARDDTVADRVGQLV
jgi:hypothetical protein